MMLDHQEKIFNKGGVANKVELSQNKIIKELGANVSALEEKLKNSIAEIEKLNSERLI